MTDHPSFPNPTITEALCEIHFSPPNAIGWNPATYGQLLTLIQDDFPLIEPVAGVPIRMRYRHQSRPLLIQLSENLLTVNQIQSYAGWAQMQTDVLDAWSRLREVIGPASIQRIGLRYINIISPIVDGERMSDWFAPNQYVAQAVLESGPASGMCDVQIAKGTRVIVRTGEVARLDNETQRGFVLDIDAVKNEQLNNSLDLAAEIEALHSIVWDVFNSFRMPRLNSLLNQEAS